MKKVQLLTCGSLICLCYQQSYYTNKEITYSHNLGHLRFEPQQPGGGETDLHQPQQADCPGKY